MRVNITDPVFFRLPLMPVSPFKMLFPSNAPKQHNVKAAPCTIPVKAYPKIDQYVETFLL